jgi:hypothetical protein
MFKPVDGATLAVFRICFGAILSYYAFVEAYPWPVYFRYVLPKVHFTFPLFDYLHLKIAPPDLLLMITKVMGIAATWIAFGLFYRFALVTFIGSFGYLFLIEKAYFNNHCYLLLLLSFLLIFIRADRSFSLDALRDPGVSRRTIPFWNIFLLRAQLCLVYFFAAIPKLYPDFLGGRQMSMFLITQDKLHLLNTFVPMDLAVIFSTYAALIFDLTIGFFLCYKRTRRVAVLVTILFHVLNGYMFPIGIFPYLMIASLILFVDPDKPRTYWQRLRSFILKRKRPTDDGSEQTPQPVSPAKMRLTMGFIMFYLLIQVLLPFRHFLIPGNANWTKEGVRFTWMLMANVMSGSLNVVVLDPVTNESIPVDLTDDLNYEQYTEMTYSPDMIYQYVQYLKKKFQAQGIEDPAIYIDSYVSINGRKHRPFIDPTVNMAEKEYKFMQAADWILPPPEDM